MKRIVSETFQQVLPIVGKGPVFLAIGMFDGVHLGHQAVLGACIRAAEACEGRAGVLTFAPHPSRLFHPEKPVRLIQNIHLKEICLRELGLDFLIEQKFDRAFSQIQAEDFPRLLKQVIPDLRAVYVGKNWLFGKGREGNVTLLTEWLAAMEVSLVSLDRIEFNGEPISSTRIRTLLEEGNIDKANELLGYRYFSDGQVVSGKCLGRTIGFPTLNLIWDPELRPRLGVYQVQVTDQQTGQVWQAIANYGVRPTVDAEAGVPLLEVHLLFEGKQRLSQPDRNLPGPGSSLKVEWLTFIRPETRFASVNELKQQIGSDVEAVRKQIQKLAL